MADRLEELRREQRLRELRREQAARLSAGQLQDPQARAAASSPEPHQPRRWTRAETDPQQLGRAVQTGLTRGAVGTAGTLGALGNLIGENVPGAGFLQNDFGYQGAERRMANLVGPQYEPRGRLEEALSLGAEFVPGAGVAGAVRRGTIGGADVVRSLAREGRAEAAGAGGAVAGQQALYGTDAQGMAELGGALLGGGAASLRRATGADSPERAIRARTRDVTDADYTQAERRAQMAQDMGFPITPDEAIGSPGLRRVASDALDQPEGARLARVRNQRLDRPSLDDASSAQPGQFRSVVDRFIEQNLAQTPQPVRTATESAARAAFDLRRQRSAAVRPHYEAARQRVPDNDVPLDDVLEIHSMIRRLAREAPEGSPAATRLNEMSERLRRTGEGRVEIETNAGVLDQVYQEFRVLMDINPASGDARYRPGVGALSEPLDMLQAVTSQNPNIEAGRRLYREFTDQELRPVLEGPIGRIAGGDNRRVDQLDTLMNNFIRGADFDATDFNRAVRQMSRVDGGREALEGLTSHYMGSLVDKATAATVSGPRANPSAQFSSYIQGDVRRNLNSLFDALDAADQSAGLERANRRQAFSNLMTVLDSTQAPTRTRGASLSDQELAAGSGAMTRRALATFRPLMSPAAAMSQSVSESIQRARVRAGWEKIAEAITTTGPEGVRAIRRMATTPARVPAAARAAAELLAVRGRLYYDSETGEDTEVRTLAEPDIPPAAQETMRRLEMEREIQNRNRTDW